MLTKLVEVGRVSLLLFVFHLLRLREDGWMDGSQVFVELSEEQLFVGRNERCCWVRSFHHFSLACLPQGQIFDVCKGQQRKDVIPASDKCSGRSKHQGKRYAISQDGDNRHCGKY